MITGPRSHFERRCLQRGYSWNEVRPCIIAEEGDTITVDERHPSYPRPRDQVDAAPSPLVGQSFGPGSELKKLLARIGIVATATCSCNARAQVMDERGIAWCEQNIDEIVGWLREEATKRNLPFLDAAGRLLVQRAIANARRVAGQ